MNKENIKKALELFDREDLINDIEDLDTNIEVFMTVNQMIYYSELKQENKELKEKIIDKAIEEIEKDKMEQFDDYIIYLLEKYLEILKR